MPGVLNTSGRFRFCAITKKRPRKAAFFLLERGLYQLQDSIERNRPDERAQIRHAQGIERDVENTRGEIKLRGEDEARRFQPGDMNQQGGADENGQGFEQVFLGALQTGSDFTGR